MKVEKLVSMVQFIINIDWMTTSEFCDAYNVPHPYFTGQVKTSVDQFLQIDAIKCKMFIEYAKLLSKKITAEVLEKYMCFESVDVRGCHPQYKKGKYTITNDDHGFWLEPYDSVDGSRITKIEDLINYNLSYNG